MKRQKNDAADAETIAEAASRPTMRFVALKTSDQQAAGMTFRVRDTLVRQRTQLVNALRGHLAEFGVVAPVGIARVDRLAEAVERPCVSLPEAVRERAHRGWIRSRLSASTSLGWRRSCAVASPQTPRWRG